MARRLELQLLGRFAVELDGRVVPSDAWRRRRAAAVVKLLALAPGHRLTREELIDALWPQLDARAGAANLRKATHHARRALGVDVDGAVVADRGSVALLPGGLVTTDVARFEAAASDALSTRDPEACRRAAAQCTGELLPDDLFEEWCAERRQQLRALFTDLLVAGRMWGRVLDVEPTSEVAHRGIMRERFKAGDRAGALRQFESLRTVLREELGVSPDPESTALYDQVLAGEGRDAPTPAERARALLAWGVVHWERSELAESERTAQEARALAVDAGLGRELAEASELLSLVAYAQGRWREVFGRELLRTIDRAPELAPFVFDANACMSEFALHEPDGLVLVAELAEHLLEVADRTSSDQARALGHLLRGETTLLSGSPAAAEPHLVKSARLHAAVGSASGEALAVTRLADASAAQGRARAAGQLHRRSLQLATDSAIPQHLLPLVYGGMLATAGPDEASGLLDSARAALEGATPCAPCSMSLHIGASVAFARSGSLDRAHHHLAQAEEIAGMWRGGPWRAAVDEARSTVRSASGAAGSEVRGLLGAAAETFAAAGRRRDAQRCRGRLAALS